MAKSERFGTTDAGEEVTRVVLEGGGLTAHILTWGAIIQDLRLDGHSAPLVLGFERFEDYLHHSPYFGATPGRYANRIADGRFTLDGETYQLDCNEKGVSHLHGGANGYGHRNWDLVDHGSDFVHLRLVDPDGTSGYPGTATVNCTYRLLEGGILNVVYETETDKPTIANICQHSYFNLDGESTALGHELEIAADRYLPVDERLIPVGGPQEVEGTPFDFREMRRMGRVIDGKPFVYDHNFCLSDGRVEKRHVVTARSPVSNVELRVATTEPGVQYYAGAYVDVKVPGHGGRIYGAFSGFCLETQVWPDGPNQEGFPDTVVRPGETLRQETDYIFSKG